MTSLVDSAFSRAGINSKEKFQILKQLQQVITRRSQSQDPLPAQRERFKPAKHEIPANVLAELMRIPEQDSEEQEGKREGKGKEKSFMFAVQSRDDYYAAHTLKSSGPPCGHYNISYSQVDKNMPAPKLVEATFTPHPEAVQSTELPPPLKLPKIHRKHIRMVPFSKQSRRKPMISEFEGPHEKRFMLSNLITTVSTKYKSSSSPDLTRCIPRTDSLFASQSSAPEYSPNKEMLMKDLGRVAQFSKMPKRKPFFELRPLPEGYDVSFRAVEPNLPNVDFGKNQGRKVDPTSPLPSFMHVTTSRIALEAQTKKAYQMNCTNDSFFTSVNTSLLGKSNVSPASGDVSKAGAESRKE